MTSNNILISFDSIYNVELGLLCMIKEKYNNPDFIISSLLDIPEKILINELIQRKENNPLSIILRPDYKDKQDKLLSEFYTNEYESIISNVKKTDLYKLVNMYKMTGIIQITILCKNIHEKQYINSNTNYRVLMYEDISNKIISKYDCIYVKNCEDLIKFASLQGKNIYIANYKYNLEDDGTPLADVVLLIIGNEISIIDIYVIDDSYKAIG